MADTYTPEQREVFDLLTEIDSKLWRMHGPISRRSIGSMRAGDALIAVLELHRQMTGWRGPNIPGIIVIGGCIPSSSLVLILACRMPSVWRYIVHGEPPRGRT